jgi:hypothetical protein
MPAGPRVRDLALGRHAGYPPAVLDADLSRSYSMPEPCEVNHDPDQVREQAGGFRIGIESIRRWTAQSGIGRGGPSPSIDCIIAIQVPAVFPQMARGSGLAWRPGSNPSPRDEHTISCLRVRLI